MAQSHDARLAELVAELGGDEVRFLFRDLVEKALQELNDATYPVQSTTRKSMAVIK